jgi:glycosyltransferase involved in cell wall biosynthesis
MARICITPAVDRLGGMTSFRLKFEAGLQTRGIEVTHDLSQPADSVLLISGTRNLLPLWKARQRGTRIVQRLDGINWVHRKRDTGLKHYLRAEYGNFILSFIRRRIATKIIYQSKFSKGWWEDWYDIPRASSTVIHNGVDLNFYSPGRTASPTYPPYKLLIVEGNLGGGYDMGLDNAVQLTETLNIKHNLLVELMVVGRISDEHKAQVQSRAHVPVKWMGAVARERIPEIDRSAHLLFSADLNPACPNSVIEAMACGLPVVAFDTGALNELVLNDSGRLVPYGSDPWKIEQPDIPALANAAVGILKDQERFSKNVRAQAESAFGLDKMVDSYLNFLLNN